ncbi:MAG: hypothetical protein ABL951_00860 [Alphaproteobacteria bacterium]
MDSKNVLAIHGGKPEKLISDALGMLSACALHHVCPGRARIVVHQLELITSSRDIDPLLRLTCQQLLNTWENTLRRFAQEIDEEEALRHIH